MTTLEAAYKVLSECGEPLHYQELTKRMMDGGLWSTDGATPAASVNAALAMDIKHRAEKSRFRRTAPGVFAINQSVDDAAPAPSDPTPVSEAKVFSFTDAAERVLNQYSDRKPMHYRDITAKALELGWIATTGQTPAATMYAQILTEVARKAKRGEQPRFEKYGKGMVGLTRWTGRGLAVRIEEHNLEIRKKLHQQIGEMPPAGFEGLVRRLLTAMGFEDVALTPLSGDGGIDVRGTLVVGDVIRTKMAVQVKRWKKNVHAPTVQQVRGSLGTHEQGLIITTSDFSTGAKEEAVRSNAVPVALMNGEQLVTLLIENDIGVRRTTHDLIELGEEDDEA